MTRTDFDTIPHDFFDASDDQPILAVVDGKVAIVDHDEDGDEDGLTTCPECGKPGHVSEEMEMSYIFTDHPMCVPCKWRIIEQAEYDNREPDYDN